MDSNCQPRELEPSLFLLRALELCRTAADRLGVETARRPVPDLNMSVVQKLQDALGQIVHDDILTLLAVSDPVASHMTGLKVEAVGNWGRWYSDTVSYDDYMVEVAETGSYHGDGDRRSDEYDCKLYTISKSAGALTLFRNWGDPVPEHVSNFMMRIGPGDDELEEALVDEDEPLSAYIEERVYAAIEFYKLPPLPHPFAVPLSPAPRLVEDRRAPLLG